MQFAVHYRNKNFPNPNKRLGQLWFTMYELQQMLSEEVQNDTIYYITISGKWPTFEVKASREQSDNGRKIQHISRKHPYVHINPHNLKIPHGLVFNKADCPLVSRIDGNTYHISEQKSDLAERKNEISNTLEISARKPMVILPTNWIREMLLTKKGIVVPQDAMYVIKDVENIELA